MNLFEEFKNLSGQPKLFKKYTTPELWSDPWVSQQMLQVHLAEDVDLASRNHAFIEKSADWIIQRFGLSAGKRICDFGCGPGLYAAPFARAGASVTGIDLSKNSLAHGTEQAEKEGLDIRYIEANYLEYRPVETFDCAVMIFCDFCVLNPGQRKIFLAMVRDSLKNGGYFFLDAFSLNFFNKAETSKTWSHNPEGGFWSPEEYIELYSLFKYENEKVLLHKYTVLEEASRRESFNWLQCYDRETLTKLFESEGFAVREWYSDVSGKLFNEGSPEIAIVVEKL